MFPTHSLPSSHDLLRFSLQMRSRALKRARGPGDRVRRIRGAAVKQDVRPRPGSVTVSTCPALRSPALTSFRAPPRTRSGLTSRLQSSESGRLPARAPPLLWTAEHRSAQTHTSSFCSVSRCYSSSRLDSRILGEHAGLRTDARHRTPCIGLTGHPASDSRRRH